MNRPGARVYSGTLANVGTGFQTLTVDSPADPPSKGWIHQVIAEITAPPGTEVALTIEDMPEAGKDLVYDDGAGGTVPVAEANWAEPAVWYEGKAGGIPVEVKTDDAGAATTVRVVLVIST